MRHALSLSLSALSLAAWTAPSSALAADCQVAGELSTCIDADNLWPHAGPSEWLAVGSSATTPEDRVAFGVTLSYLSRPIGVRVSSADPDGTLIYVVDNAINATFLWTLGITDRLELTLATPVTLWQDGAGLADILGSDQPLPRSALHDARFGFALALLARPRSGRLQDSGESKPSTEGASGGQQLNPVDGGGERRSPTALNGLGVTSRFEFTLPVGDERAFAHSPTVTLAPSLAADYRFGPLLVGAELGARIRGESEFAGARVGSQLAFGVGASFDILNRRLLTVGAEAFGLYTFAEQSPPTRDRDEFTKGPALVPAEWIASVSTAPVLGGDVRFTLGGGGPIPFSADPAITTPRFRLDLALRYAPLGSDGDGDGVLDRNDRCPAGAEDRDGFQDDDGCPDPDNDKDRVPDAQDRCRDAAETVDGFEDADGCPDGDDDKDGVPDDDDRCRNAVEDKDGFKDADGCPDPDNDGDGILDGADTCANGVEDHDGWKDEDGCPDPDNDLDQIPDVADSCPDAAEDRDGFEDADGCPEPDNDGDGALDRDDICPTALETIDGTSDGDGCPEPGARSLVSWSGESIVVKDLARFPTGKAAMTRELAKQVRMMAALMRTRAPIDGIIVEAYPDRPGDSSNRGLELATKRSEAVKAVLVEAGIPQDKITAATGDPSAKRPTGAAGIEVTVQRAGSSAPPQEKP